MDPEISDLVLFFGRFHPFILHLPIGFLIIAFILEVLSRFKRFSHYKPAVGLILYLGTAFAVLTAILGLMLSQEGGYNEDLLSLHQWSGILLAFLTVVAAVLYWQKEHKGSVVLDRSYFAALFILMLLLGITGHFGGSLTHGSDYLTQYMPDPLRKVAGLEPKKSTELKKITNLNEALIYADIIYPILESRCVSCHNNDKSKGDLKMHTIEALKKGGENGPIFLAGNAEESEMIKRIHLPENDEDHMPPKGKGQLTDEQIFLLEWWIREGAPFNERVGEITVDEKAQAVLNTLVDPNANKSEVEKLLISDISPADGEVIRKLQKKGIKVIPIAANTNWLQTSASDELIMDSVLNNLMPISEKLTWVDFGGTSTKDHHLEMVGKFNQLTRLHLENTEVTGQGLKHLKDLNYLEYLNLYNTTVNDDGLQWLFGLKNLKQLYVWQTQITEEGVAQLQKELPGLKVHLGFHNSQIDSTLSSGFLETGNKANNNLNNFIINE